MKMMLSECANAVQGTLIGVDAAFSAVSIDTRTLLPGQLYIAISGKQFDGHDFIEAATQAGALAVLVHKDVATTLPQIKVADTHLALAELAGAWRHQLSLQVVGITGSNGKTTVKEMTAAILEASTSPAQVLYTQGNLNNDIGVPLTLLRLNDAHRYAVIEMGANHPGEIRYTSHYAAADVVILNNAGAAHLEGFHDLEGVAQAKAEIIVTLKKSGIAILNRDDVYFDYWKSVAADRKILTFGFNEAADITAQDIRTQMDAKGFVTRFRLRTPQADATCEIALAGKHNVLNALAATAAALALNIDLAQVIQGLAIVKPVTGRLQLLQGLMGNRIIDDTYNANPNSLQAALDVLNECGGQTWLALGAFGETGKDSIKIHHDLGLLIKNSGVTRLYATGAEAQHTVSAFGESGYFFTEQNTLITALKAELKGNETLLVKGSRSQRMENVVAALVENFRN